MTRSVDEEILLLRHQVDELVRVLADRDATAFRPVEWGSLDREQANEEWQRLAGFVDWLVDHYGLAETIPACWYRHPPLLEELSALHAAWLGSYLDPAAPADAGIAWHDNLEKVLHRIREWDRTRLRRRNPPRRHPAPRRPAPVPRPGHVHPGGPGEPARPRHRRG